MKIDTMPAGHELDALVAEKVMGWKRHNEIGIVNASDGSMRVIPGGWLRPTGKSTFEADVIPNYSTSIEAAWTVADKLGLFFGRFSSDYCAFLSINEYMGGHQVHASTAPLAICRAALKAVKA